MIGLVDETASEAGEEGRRNGESFTEFLLGRAIGFAQDGSSGDDGVTGRSCLEAVKEAIRPGSMEL